MIYTLQEQIGCFDHWVVNLVADKLKRHLFTLVTSVQTNCETQLPWCINNLIQFILQPQTTLRTSVRGSYKCTLQSFSKELSWMLTLHPNRELPACIYHLHQPYAISLHYQSKSLITTVLQLTATRVTTLWLNNHFVFVVILQLWCAFIMNHLQKFCGCQCIVVVRWTGQVHLGLPYAISLQYHNLP